MLTRSVLLAASLLLAVDVHGQDSMPLRTSPKPDTPLRVSSGIMAGLLLHKVSPDISKGEVDRLREEHGSGVTVLHAIIGKDGHIEEIHVLSGARAIQQSVLDAVRQWVYKPYLLNGEPHAVETQIWLSIQFNAG